MDTIPIKTRSKQEFIDISREVSAIQQKKGVSEGLCCVYVPHTTAAVTINENADPSVRKDIINELLTLITREGGYTHSEGNSDAHIKSTLVGASLCIPISGGKLALGTWQGIFFCEFDGPRQREVFVQIIKGE
jgi:secondary thiamine-phosphate synthase enzyme